MATVAKSLSSTVMVQMLLIVIRYNVIEAHYYIVTIAETATLELIT